jgi:hypothetical protein
MSFRRVEEISGVKQRPLGTLHASAVLLGVLLRSDLAKTVPLAIRAGVGTGLRRRWRSMARSRVLLRRGLLRGRRPLTVLLLRSVRRRSVLLLLLRRIVLLLWRRTVLLLLRSVLLWRRAVGIRIGVIRIRIIGIIIRGCIRVRVIRIAAVIASVPRIAESKSES